MSPEPEETVKYERSEIGEQNVSNEGMYHWKHGIYFGRNEDGTVRVRWGENAPDVFIPAPEWASIVAFVSALGETTDSYCKALHLHDGR